MKLSNLVCFCLSVGIKAKLFPVSYSIWKIIACGKLFRKPLISVDCCIWGIESFTLLRNSRLIHFLVFQFFVKYQSQKIFIIETLTEPRKCNGCRKSYTNKQGSDPTLNLSLRTIFNFPGKHTISMTKKFSMKNVIKI